MSYFMFTAELMSGKLPLYTHDSTLLKELTGRGLYYRKPTIGRLY